MTLATARRVASPPMYGIFTGLAIALLPPLHALLVGSHEGAGGGVTHGAGGAPPLGFVLQAARLCGNAAIPLNTMLLGASLSKGPDWHAVPLKTVAGIVLSKLFFMPLAALVMGAALRATVILPPMLLLVMLMESGMPTANNLMLMCELAGEVLSSSSK